MNKQLLKFIGAIGLLITSLVIGSIGFMTIEGYSLLDAFYMSVITLSTVGYNEVKVLSADGRLFASIYIIFNLAILAYVISIISSYFFEGKLRLMLRNIIDDRHINKLEGHVIVCGYGRNGREACHELLENGREVVVLEQDKNISDNINPHKHLHKITADASLDQNLKLAGLERANEIIITTSSDAANVFIALTAREVNPNIYIVSRASNSESESKLYRAGADQVIMPDHLGGLFMAQMITKPVVIEFLDLLTGRGRDKEKYHLESISYAELKPDLRDKTLRELNINQLTGATVIAVKDNIKGLIPNPSTETFIGPDDTLILLCSDSTTSRLFNNLTGA